MVPEMTIEQLVALVQEYRAAPSSARQGEIIEEIESATLFHCYVDDSDDFCLYIPEE